MIESILGSIGGPAIFGGGSLMVVGNLRENEKVSEHCACRAFVRMERLKILKSFLFDRDGIFRNLQER